MDDVGKALSKRARFLLARDGRDSWLGGVHLGKDLTLPELYLSIDDKGTLVVEYNAVESPTIFSENEDGSVEVTSDDQVLRSTLAILGKYTVLDDLSSI